MVNRKNRSLLNYFSQIIYALSTPTGWLLVLANLFPVYGYFYLQWDLTNLIILYWMENVVIWFYNIVKMTIVSFTHFSTFKDRAGSVFSTVFFALHFGMFTYAHGSALAAALNYVEELHIKSIPELIQINLVGFAVLMLSHGFSFIYNFLINGEHKTAQLADLMFRPYSRIGPIHITVIFYGVGMGFLGAMTDQNALTYSSLLSGLLLILLKTLSDLNLHAAEHRKYLRQKQQ